MLILYTTGNCYPIFCFLLFCFVFIWDRNNSPYWELKMQILAFLPSLMVWSLPQLWPLNIRGTLLGSFWEISFFLTKIERLGKNFHATLDFLAPSPPQFFPALLEIVWVCNACNGCSNPAASYSRHHGTEDGKEKRTWKSLDPWYCWVTESTLGTPTSGPLLYAAKHILTKYGRYPIFHSKKYWTGKNK